MELASGPSSIAIALPRTGFHQSAGQISKDTRPRNHTVTNHGPVRTVLKPSHQGGPQGSGSILEASTPCIRLPHIVPEHISSVMKCHLAGIDTLPLANQKIPTSKVPIRRISGRPRITIRDSTHSKINVSSWLLIRVSHWANKRGRSKNVTGKRRKIEEKASKNSRSW